MANKSISQLPNATALTGDELLAIVQSDETRQTSINSFDNYIVPTSVTMEDGGSVDLTDEQYKNTFLVKMTWTGAQGTAYINLPSVELSVNRTYRIITDGTFAANTMVEILPYILPDGSLQTTIDGQNNLEINKAYEGVKIWTDGSEWFVIQRKS